MASTATVKPASSGDVSVAPRPSSVEVSKIEVARAQRRTMIRCRDRCLRAMAVRDESLTTRLPGPDVEVPRGQGRISTARLGIGADQEDRHVA